MIPLFIRGATHRVRPPTKFNMILSDLMVVIRKDIRISRWEPTPKELKLLNEGGSVEIRILGCQPPIKVGVHKHELDEGDQ